MRWGGSQHKAFITPSFPIAGSSSLQLRGWPIQMPHNLLWRRQVCNPFPPLLFQTPFTHQICDILFTHWLRCFLGKQESKTVVLIISRILKKKKISKLYMSSYYQDQWNSQRISSLYFLSSWELNSLPRDGTPASCCARAECESLDHNGRPHSDNFKQRCDPSWYTFSSRHEPSSISP